MIVINIMIYLIFILVYLRIYKENIRLRCKEKEYHKISDAIKEAIITTDINCIILDCNAATALVFGWSKEKLIGNNILVLIPEQYRKLHIEGMKQYKETGSSSIFNKAIDTEGLCLDGTIIPIALSIVPVNFENRILFCSVVRDISHRKANERQISLLNETLRIRVSALEAFQFSVVHDLNAPLRALEGFSQILMEDYIGLFDKQGKDYINRIFIAVARMRQLVNDMLRLSHVTQPGIELKKEEVNSSEIVSNILSEHLYSYNPNNRKYTFIVEPNIVINADRELISIVLTNIISNAWKFTGKKEVTEIEFGMKMVNNSPIYFVKDNGVGFDMSKKDKLFKPFSRLHDKREFDGNGVGLAIAKQIISLHEGNIWAEGEVGQGAIFYFTIGNKYAEPN